MRDDIRTREFLDGVCRSIRAVLRSRFPTLTPGECEDVEQDVQLKIWKTLANGTDVRHFRSYLWKVVFTTALDALDQRGRFASLDETIERGRDFLRDGAPTPEALWERHTLRAQVRRAVEGLPRRRREVLRRHLAGQGLEQTALALGWSRHQVRHLLYRGIGELRRKLAR